jgi:hypothetical protein
VKATIAAILAADAAFAGLLPGGIHTAAEISRQATPAAFTADGVLRACCLVKDGPATRDASGIPGSSRELVELYLYQFGSSDAIESARRRARALLDEQAAGDGAVGLVWQGDIRGLFDDPLRSQLIIGRYAAAVRR